MEFDEEWAKEPPKGESEEEKAEAEDAAEARRRPSPRPRRAAGGSAILMAMSDENVEVVRRVYDEWGRGNFRPRFDFYDDEMEWGWSDEFPGLAGVYRDPAERNKRLAEWLSPWEHWTATRRTTSSTATTSSHLCRYRGRGKGSGAIVDTQGRAPLDAARRQGDPPGGVRRPGEGARRRGLDSSVLPTSNLPGGK